MKISYKRNKDGSVTVHFERMTQGGALALCSAINAHAEGGSVVGQDLQQILRSRVQASTSMNDRDKDQELFESLSRARNSASTPVAQPTGRDGRPRGTVLSQRNEAYL